MQYKKITQLSELEDGWYWWKSDGTGPKNQYQFPITLLIIDGKVENNHGDRFKKNFGKFAGPIPTPVELDNLLFKAISFGNEIGPEAMPCDVLNEWEKEKKLRKP